MEDPKQVVRRGYDALSHRYDNATNATSKYQSWTGTDDNWLDGGAPMWWSHADTATYRNWLTDAGLVVDTESFVPEGSGGHTLFWTHRLSGT